MNKITGTSLLWRCVALASMLTYALAFPSVSLDKNAYDETYRDFIQGIRDAIPKTGLSHGIKVLPAQSSVSANEQFVLASVEGHKGQTVTFALNVVDLYLVGFKVGDKAYYFVGKDKRPYVDLGSVFKDAKLTVNVGRGDYDHLESKAKENRGARAVGVRALIQAVTDLAKEVSGSRENLQERSRALLVIIQMISEAARFNSIEDAVTAGEGVRLSSDLIDLENSWANISEEAQSSNQLPDRARDLALMKYYRGRN